MIPIHTLLHDSSYAGPSPRPLLNFCSRTKCESVGVQPRPILDIIFPWCKFLYSVDIDAELSQISLGQVDFLHELLVRLRNVVESKNAPAETEEEDGTEGDEGPEGKHGENLLLHQRRQRDQFQIEGEIERGDEEAARDGLLGARHGCGGADVCAFSRVCVCDLFRGDWQWLLLRSERVGGR